MYHVSHRQTCIHIYCGVHDTMYVWFVYTIPLITLCVHACGVVSLHIIYTCVQVYAGV